jgi:hypothetical protein
MMAARFWPPKRVTTRRLAGTEQPAHGLTAMSFWFSTRPAAAASLPPSSESAPRQRCADARADCRADRRDNSDLFGVFPLDRRTERVSSGGAWGRSTPCAAQPACARICTIRGRKFMEPASLRARSNRSRKAKIWTNGGFRSFAPPKRSTTLPVRLQMTDAFVRRGEVIPQFSRCNPTPVGRTITRS